MPRSSSSRYKSSHKQHKHSSKDAREVSESEEDANLKDRKGREDGSVRVSSSAEKRKLVSQFFDGKDLVSSGNGDLVEEYSASKRRKERSDVSGTDRWNGGSGSSVVAAKDSKGEREREKERESLRIDSEKGLKSKILVESKSKSSRRHESSSEKKELVVVVDNEDVKRSSNSSKVESKSKFEKDLGRKDTHYYKEVKEKEHGGGGEKDRKNQDGRRERSIERVSGKGVVGSEESRKPGSHAGSMADDRTIKRDAGNTECQMHDELRNHELEKELEKRGRKRRDSSDEKDKHQDDARDGNERRVSTKDDRPKNERNKDERIKDERNKDERIKDERNKDERMKDERNKDERYKDTKYKDDGYRDKYREDLDRDRRGRDEKRRDERSSKDHTSDRLDTRLARDDSRTIDYHKKSKTLNGDRDSSSRFDDRDTRYKDIRGKKRSSDDEDHNDLRPRSSKELRYEVEKKLSSGKVEMLSDRGRSQARLVDVDHTVSSGRLKSSPSSGAHIAKDQYRHSSRHTETKYKDSMTDDRIRMNIASSREHGNASGVGERVSEFRLTEKPRSVVKPMYKDENQLPEPSADKSPVSDAEVSPMPQKEKSISSAGIDRRHSNRMPVRRNLDVEEGRRSFGSKDGRDYSVNEDRRSQEWPLEKPAADDSQADDTLSVSSSFNKGMHTPGGPPLLPPPPPPFRSGVDSPSVYSSFEDDSRGKSNNRYKRSGDSNVGRGQGNAWKGVPNWTTPVTNGFVPYHVSPGGYHAMIPQYPGPPIFNVRPSMDMNPAGVPYHIPDVDRFSVHGRSFGWRNPADEPHMHGWDGNTVGFRDDSLLHGRSDWDQNRHPRIDRGWEPSMASWKGPNSAANLELSSASIKEDNLIHAPVDDGWSGKPGQHSRNERHRPPQAESFEIKPDAVSPPQESVAVPTVAVHEKTPELSKGSNDVGARSFHIYLSKLDISEDLTHPELYKKCMSVLDKDTHIGEEAIKNLHIEDGVKAGAKISKAILKASLFPTVKDSVFQRAMTLYKQQADEVKAKFPVSLFPGPGPKTLATAGEKVKPAETITVEKGDPVPSVEGHKERDPPTFPEGEKEQAPGPTSTIVEHGLMAPALNSVIVDLLVCASNQQKVEEIPTSGHAENKELVPTSDDEMGEDAALNYCEMEAAVRVPVPGDAIAEEAAPCLNHVEIVDEAASSGLENPKPVKSHSPLHASHSTVNSPSNGDTLMVSDRKDEEIAFSASIMCGPLGFTDGSEACEAMMPESIECRSVNISRIHSPESTH